MTASTISHAGGPGPHHHVLDSGGGGEQAGQVFGEGGRAHRADVQH